MFLRLILMHYVRSYCEGRSIERSAIKLYELRSLKWGSKICPPKLTIVAVLAALGFSKEIVALPSFSE
jgi:hypothetical protein